jgi:hypothetical protein
MKGGVCYPSNRRKIMSGSMEIGGSEQAIQKVKHALDRSGLRGHYEVKSHHDEKGGLVFTITLHPNAGTKSPDEESRIGDSFPQSKYRNGELYIEWENDNGHMDLVIPVKLFFHSHFVEV